MRSGSCNCNGTGKTPVDWTPVFKGFENGCNSTKQFDEAFWESAIQFNPQKDRFELGKVNIGQPYAASLGTPELKHMPGAVGEYFFPINGTYRGVPIGRHVFDTKRGTLTCFSES